MCTILPTTDNLFVMKKKLKFQQVSEVIKYHELDEKKIFILLISTFYKNNKNCDFSPMYNAYFRLGKIRVK